MYCHLPTAYPPALSSVTPLSSRPQLIPMKWGRGRVLLRKSALALYERGAVELEVPDCPGAGGTGLTLSC